MCKLQYRYGVIESPYYCEVSRYFAVPNSDVSSGGTKSLAAVPGVSCEPTAAYIVPTNVSAEHLATEANRPNMPLKF
jgi:hypothetical protein